MSAQNPFREFWQQLLKGRGQVMGRKGLYRVTLTGNEVEELANLAKTWQGVKGVVEKSDGSAVDFRWKQAKDLAKRSNLKPFRR